MKKSIILLASLSMLIMSGCKDSHIPVSLHGVNYSGQIFSYVLVDPANESNAGGGETIDPYGAGGTMCCYTLPATWSPGMKVQINATHWLPRTADDSLPEIKETQVVDVPRYTDGKPGELWVLRGADGKVSLISSDYSPDHEKWPGKIKSWPVPTLEYKRERWDLYINDAAGDIRVWEKQLDAIHHSPEKYAKSAWEEEKKLTPDTIKKFTGPDDPQFLISQKQDFIRLLEARKKQLEALKRERP